MEDKLYDGPISATVVPALDSLPHSQRTNDKISLSHGKTILVVEDDLGFRTVVGFLLRSHGYRLLEASHPVEAESLVRHCIDPIHLVLMDVTLPGINGYELARILIDFRSFPAMLFVSGYEQDFFDVDRTVCVKSGFLLKPFGLMALSRRFKGYWKLFSRGLQILVLKGAAADLRRGRGRRSRTIRGTRYGFIEGFVQDSKRFIEEICGTA